MEQHVANMKYACNAFLEVFDPYIQDGGVFDQHQEVCIHWEAFVRKVNEIGSSKFGPAGCKDLDKCEQDVENLFVQRWDTSKQGIQNNLKSLQDIRSRFKRLKEQADKLVM